MVREIQLFTRAATRLVAGSYDDLLALAKKRAPDPTVFDEFDAAFWQAEISNNRLDSYYTSMSPTFLAEQVRFLNEGISYQDSHNWFQLGDGQSLRGELVKHDEKVPEVEQDLVEVHATFYTLRGLNINGRNTNDLLAAMRAGVTRDVSIGFSSEDISCSLCDKQMFEFDWENPDENCVHIPGVRYGDIKKLAWGSVNTGGLNETSGVFDGSNPTTKINYVIQKAEELMEATGEIDSRIVDGLEARYQQRVKRPARVYGGIDMGTRATISTGEGAETLKRITEEQATALKEKGFDGDLSVDSLAAALLEALERIKDLESEIEGGVDDTLSDAPDRAALEAERDELLKKLADLDEKLGLLSTEVDELRSVADEKDAEITRLKPLAEQGERYREVLVQDTLDEGVRAHGNEFRRADWESVLAGMDMKAVELTRDTFMGEAKKRLPIMDPITRGLPTDDDKKGTEVSGSTHSRSAKYRG